MSSSLTVTSVKAQLAACGTVMGLTFPWLFRLMSSSDAECADWLGTICTGTSKPPEAAS